MTEIHTCTSDIMGLISVISKLDREGTKYADEWLKSYINQWFMVN